MRQSIENQVNVVRGVKLKLQVQEALWNGGTMRRIRVCLHVMELHSHTIRQPDRAVWIADRADLTTSHKQKSRWASLEVYWIGKVGWTSWSCPNVSYRDISPSSTMSMTCAHSLSDRALLSVILLQVAGFRTRSISNNSLVAVQRPL